MSSGLRWQKRWTLYSHQVLWDRLRMRFGVFNMILLVCSMGALAGQQVVYFEVLAIEREVSFLDPYPYQSNYYLLLS